MIKFYERSIGEYSSLTCLEVNAYQFIENGFELLFEKINTNLNSMIVRHQYFEIFSFYFFIFYLISFTVYAEQHDD